MIRGRRYNYRKNQGARTDLTLGQNVRKLQPTTQRIDSTCPQNEGRLPTTAQKLAQEHGVSRATIERDGQFATNVEALKPFVPEIEQMVMAKPLNYWSNNRNRPLI